MIPVSEPWVGEREEQYLLDAFRSGWISSAGSYIDKFEHQWANYCNRKHGVAVSNGTTALELAVKALNLPPGSEVIMPTFTIISCALAVIRNQLKPVYIDSDPTTWGMNVKQIEEKLTKDTRAIMVVHIYGHPVDMDPVLELATRKGLKVIEDAAEVHGARYRGRICGSFGDVSIFSFYANKIICTGEGGMVVTNDDTLAARCKSYRNLCFREDRRFLHTELGHNFRFTNLHAAIGLAQVEKIEEALQRKRWLGSFYNEALRDIPDLQLPPVTPWGENVYWVYGIVLGDSYPFDAAILAEKLKQKGIQTRPFFLGMHEQPALKNFAEGKDRYPVAERLAKRGLYLPSGLTITEDQARTSSEALKSALRELVEKS